MNPFEHLSELDPFANPQSESALPPQTSCARLSDVLALVEPRLGAALLDAPGRAALHYVANRISCPSLPLLGARAAAWRPRPARRFPVGGVAQGNGGIPDAGGPQPP